TGNNLENINGGMFVSGPYLLSGLRNMPGNTWKFYNTFINHISIKNISDYRNDSILLATHAGAFVVRSNVNEQYVLANKRFFSTRSTSALLLPDDKILIGTPNGLFITDFRAGGEKKIDDPLLRDANVTDMELGTDGNILIGTSVQGIFLYKYSNGKLTFRTTVKSAGTSYVNRIYKQNDTTYWASTDRGACRIDFTGDMTEKSGRVYTFFDGLPSSNVSAVFVKNDTAYVATSEGIGVLPLNHMPEISSSFPFWLTRALLDDTALHFPGNEIHLNYNRNNIRLELSAILYESLGSLSFLYRINGLSDKWLETNNPEISLSGLAPGNYKLEVFAVNFNGIKSQQPLLVSIIVHPAFWQTTWFKWMSAVIAVVLLLFIIWRLISREKIKQFNKFQTQRRLAELELEAIKAQINPHFVYNCLNSIQYFNYKNDYASVRQYFSRFAKLIRQTMRFSRETFITLDEETAYLTNYLELEKIRFKEKLDYYIQIDDKLPGSLLIPSMMVQPYVENALKHGVSELDKCGEVRVIFEPDANNWLKILVEDNGPGFAPADKPGDGVHLGHRIAGSRAQAYNQLFGVNIRFLIKPKVTSTGVISGTVVELLIPPIKYENTRV
ncbi:MAG TPA: histidine kinase, partial [Bacteroidia bacterium]|nr:histidine kinase [Bacteroidia bacterium]